MSKGQSAPIIAILTMPDEQRLFRGNRNNFIDIIQTGKKLKIPVYIVTTKDINIQERLAFGYSYSASNNSWTRKQIPFPNIIYNRIPSREDEFRPEVKKLLDECIKHPRIQFYNPGFFNKWHLFEWLSRNKATRIHVPQTQQYHPNIKLLPMLKKYKVLYLKPEKGKAGTGIMRIRRITQPRVSYTLSTQTNRSSQTIYFTTISKLKEHLNSTIVKQAYIVQQGINLLAIDNRPFDLRVLLQKNKRGRWAITGIGARLAGESSITTHVPRGGSIESPSRLLSSSFGQLKAKSTIKRSQQTAILLAKQIEKRSGHELGEMSMDLGVDKQAKIWFFEANSKPMKFDEPHIREKSLNRFFEYCQYLNRNKKSMSTNNYELY